MNSGRSGAQSGPEEHVRVASVASGLFVAILVVRWVAIGGAGDWGWSYEVAARILEGQIYGRDFVVTVGPVSYYLAAAFLAVFGSTLLATSVFLHFCWIAALAVGWRTAIRFGARRDQAAAGVALAAALSFPGDSMGHLYNYIVTAFTGLALLLLFHPADHGRLTRAAIAGTAMGLAVLTKQNVGLLMAVAAPAIVLIVCLAQSKRLPLLALACYSVALAATILAVLTWLSLFSDVQDLLRLLLFDASAGKGGFLKTVLRGLPRLSLGGWPGWPIQARAHIEIPLTLAAWSLAALVVAWGWRRNCFAGDARLTRASREAVFAAAALALVAVLTALPFEEAGRAFRSITGLLGPLPPARALSQFAYIGASIALAGFVLLSLYRPVETASGEDAKLAVVLGMLALAWSHNTSGVDYFRYSSPVVAPVAACVLQRCFGWRPGSTFLIAVAVAAVTHLFPFYSASFVELRGMDGGAFSRTLIRAEEHALYQRRYGALHSEIANRRTLWITPGGPHQAYGGRPVPNIPAIFQDTHASRHEWQFLQQWRENPPERIVVEPIVTPAGKGAFADDAFREWLETYYRRVELPGAGTRELPELWALRTTLDRE